MTEAPLPQITNESEAFVVEIRSPNLAPAKIQSCGSYGGKYGMKIPIENFLNTFYIDHSADGVSDPVDVEEAAKSTAAAVDGRPADTEPVPVLARESPYDLAVEKPLVEIKLQRLSRQSMTNQFCLNN